MRRFFIVLGLLALLLPAAVSAQHMELSKEQVYECRENITVTSSNPTYCPEKLQAAVPLPPNLSQQRLISQKVYLEGLGLLKEKFQRDESPLAHPIGWIDTEIPAGSIRGMMKVTVITRVAVRSRWLAAGKPPASEPVPVLSPEDTVLYLSPTEVYDFANPTFDNWLSVSGAEKSDGESRLDYTRRVMAGERELIAYSKLTAYSNQTLQNIQASFTLAQKVGNCGSIAALYVAILRSQGIPSRLMSGRFLKDGDIRNTAHNMAEFWLDRVGWVPVDPAMGTCGIDQGFLTNHWDPGFELPGSQKIITLQVPWFRYFGGGTTTFSTVDDWKVYPVV